MRDDAFLNIFKLTLFWCLSSAGAGLTNTKGVKTTLLESLDCSLYESKSRCEGMSRACDWRVEGFDHRGTCENKFDTIYDGNIIPFIRNGRGTKKIKASQYPSSELDRCIAPVITDLANEPCYALSFKNIDECGCNAQMERSYMIPKHGTKRDERHLRLSKPLLRDHTMFIFIHANKAAGETIKSIAYQALRTNHWDGAALGTRVGWQFLEQTMPVYDFPKPSRRRSSINNEGKPMIAYAALDEMNRGKIMHAACGERFSTFEDAAEYLLDENQPLSSAYDCPLRFVWGNAAMGLCDHFPGMPCVYFTVLRDPMSRALSDYFYFCIDGAEGRKKWTPEMLARGECNMNPLQWFTSMRTSPFFYQERLTRSCDANCGVQAALENLFHPCVRYILLEKFTDGLKRIQKAFSPAFDEAIESFLQAPRRVNKRGHGSSRSKLKTRVISNSTLEKLKDWLREDYVIYDEAVKRYEEQWERPIESCNEFSFSP